MKPIKRLAPIVAIMLLLSGNTYGQQLTPPPEAVKACEGKSVGDTSEFTGPRGGKVTGICKDVDGKLALQPDRSKATSSSGPPSEAFKACEGKSVGDASEFAGPRGETVSGKCEELNGKLVLRPGNFKAKN